MHTIITIEPRKILQSLKDGGCFECQTSCQSACKTSCGVANQSCEQKQVIKHNSISKKEPGNV